MTRKELGRASGVLIGLALCLAPAAIVITFMGWWGSPAAIGGFGYCLGYMCKVAEGALKQ